MADATSCRVPVASCLERLDEGNEGRKSLKENLSDLGGIEGETGGGTSNASEVNPDYLPTSADFRGLMKVSKSL